MRRENLHLTLLFLGSVDVTQQRCLEAAAATYEGASFELRLDHLGSFPRARVAWLGAQAMPESLLGLVRHLERAAGRCGIPVDRRPFRAHLTLARKISRPVSAPVSPPLAWHIGAFSLLASDTRAEGVEYRLVETWRLGPEAH